MFEGSRLGIQWAKNPLDRRSPPPRRDRSRSPRRRRSGQMINVVSMSSNVSPTFGPPLFVNFPISGSSTVRVSDDAVL